MSKKGKKSKKQKKGAAQQPVVSGKRGK